jgi:hypothetical protein
VTNDSLPGILRASDLIGQLADINYIKKIPRLYTEFQQIGADTELGYHSPADLRESYPMFFWGMLSPYIDASLEYLNVTQEGKSWLASLHAHVFIKEHTLHSVQKSPRLSFANKATSDTRIRSDRYAFAHGTVAAKAQPAPSPDVIEHQANEDQAIFAARISCTAHAQAGLGVANSRKQSGSATRGCST